MNNLLILSGLGFLIYKFLNQSNDESINITKAKKLLKNNYFDFILDVRSEKEYQEGHYKNAINIPYKKISDNLNINKNSKILIYCRSGRRAKIALDKLKSYGFSNLNYIKNTYHYLL